MKNFRYFYSHSNIFGKRNEIGFIFYRRREIPSNVLSLEFQRENKLFTSRHTEIDYVAFILTYAPAFHCVFSVSCFGVYTGRGRILGILHLHFLMKILENIFIGQIN